MRHILIALLIAFLPLRGWVGDSMAAQMATAAVVQHNAADRAAGAHGAAAERSLDVHAASGSSTAALGDCGDHAASMVTSSSDPSHCQSCVVCQACSFVALVLPSADGDTAVPRSQVLRMPAAPGFTSADRALGLKPPIY